MHKYINVRPVIVIDEPDAHQVWLDVGCQHFTVGEYCETKEQAEWLSSQLQTALLAIISESIPSASALDKAKDSQK